MCPGVGLLDHTVALFLDFERNSLLFSIVAAPIYIPTNSVGGLIFSTPSPAFIVCRLFHNGHSDHCEVIPHFSFGLQNIKRVTDVENKLIGSSWGRAGG